MSDRVSSQTWTTTDVWDGFLGSNYTRSGVHVDFNLSMSLTACWRAYAIISGILATLPIKILKGSDQKETEEHVAWWLLNMTTSDSQEFVSMPSFFFRQSSLIFEISKGNSYSEIVRLNSSKPVALKPYWNPDSCYPQKIENGEYIYHTSRSTGEYQVRDSSEILHYRYMPKDGVIGRSMIQYGAEALGLASAIENQAATIYRRGRPQGFISYPADAPANAVENINKICEETNIFPEIPS